MENLKLNFESVSWSPWLVLLVALLSLLSALIFYWRNASRVTGGRLAVLALLRLTGILALLGCIFQPVLSYEKVLVNRSKVLVLMDTSKSMSIADAAGADQEASRLERAKRAVAPFVAGIRENFDVEIYRFDAAATKLKDDRELAALKPEGQVTALDPAIRQVAGEHRGEDIAAIIPVTDGIDNSGKADYQSLERLGAKVCPVGVGTKLSSLETFKDIIVKKVVPEKYAVVGNKTQIKVYIENIGFKNPVLDLKMQELDGKPAASRQALLKDVRGDQEFTVEYTPDKVGKFPFEMRIPVDKLEKIQENNAQSFILNVIDPRIRVLYVEGTVRTEYKWLKRTLEQDPQVEILTLYRVRGAVFQQYGNVEGITLSGFPKNSEELKQFKVIIFGDLDRTFLTNAQLDLMEQGVRDGMGFIMLGGYNSFGPGGYGGTPLEKLLPVLCGSRDIGQEKDPFLPQLTIEGAAHPVFTGIASFFSGPDGPSKTPLNQLFGCVRVGTVKPTGKVLAVNPLRMSGNSPLPVLVVQDYGGGRSAAFAADTTWRWRSQEEVYRKFWGQMVRYLAQRKIEKESLEPGVQLYVDKGFYQTGEKVGIFADVRGEGGMAEPTAEVTVKIEGPAGTIGPLALAASEAAKGQYRLDFTPPVSGLYKSTLTAVKAAKTLGTASVSFQVGKPNLEYEDLDMRAGDLKTIASVTGGQYYYLSNIGALQDSLVARVRSKAIAYRKPVNLPILFFAFILLITGELVLRRTWQLV